MNFKIDWLTLTLKPSGAGTSYNIMNYSFCDDMNLLEDWCFSFLQLKREKKLFRRKQGSIQHYNVMYTYNGISIALSTPDRFSEQGLMFRFSAEGIAWYEKFRRDTSRNWNWISFLKEFFSFGVYGFTCRCTRIDLAFDDISYDDKNRLLDLDIIERALSRGEFCSLFRKDNPHTPLETSKELERKKGSVIGRTLNVGNRKSKVFLRFYDKLLESLAHKKVVNKNIKHWVRMEFEFKGTRAMSVIDSLILLPPAKFAEYISAVINRYIRFIVPKGDREHYYRCSSRKWWVKVVGTVEKARLVENKAYKNRFNSTMKWLQKSVFPALYSVLHCVSVDDFLVNVRQCGFSSPTAHHNEIIADYAKNTISECFDGIDIHRSSSNEYFEILKEFDKMAHDMHLKLLGYQLCEATFLEERFEKYHNPNIEGTRYKTIDDFRTSEQVRIQRDIDMGKAIDFFTYGTA